MNQINIEIPNSNIFSLSLINNQICEVIDVLNDRGISKFQHPLTGNQFKIYVLADGENILYVGITKSSIKNRLRYGLTADGKNGYYGYKWKELPLVKLFVWCFDGLDKTKIESIEAELVYLIRRSTGKWPLCQNEIHFNNLFSPNGQLIAEKLFQEIQGWTKS